MADWRIELRDRAFKIFEVLDMEAQDINWAWDFTGGCGNFGFTLPRSFADLGYITGDFNVRIYHWNTATKQYDLRYQGYIDERSPQRSKDEDKVTVKGNGYFGQLGRMLIDKDYTSQEISIIVKDILDTYITPNTDITYEAADIEATGFTPATLEFDTNCRDALQTLADIAGTRQWGVDRNRKFYFGARSSAVGYNFVDGGKVEFIESNDSFGEIINSLKIIGGDVGGNKYTYTAEHAASILKYGRRQKKINNSAIVTDDVAEQLADSIFSESTLVSRRGTMKLKGSQTFFENTLPTQLVVHKTEGVRYGERKYGTFLYSGEIEYQIQKIQYQLDRNGNLNTNLNIGQQRPNLAEKISQLEFQLEQETNR